jgi:hypothetical protein
MKAVFSCHSPSKQDPISLEGILEIQFEEDHESGSETSQIRAEITVGRRPWIYSQKLLLTKTVKTLRNHKWCIVRPWSSLSINDLTSKK